MQLQNLDMMSQKNTQITFRERLTYRFDINVETASNQYKYIYDITYLK